MASWIGASDSQRFWQYVVPAARKAVASNWFAEEKARLVEAAAKMQAALDAAEPGSFTARQANRRLETLRRDYRNAVAVHKRDLATLAEADRRAARRRVR